MSARQNHCVKAECLLLIVTLCISSLFNGCRDVSEHANALVQSYDNAQPYPNISEDNPELDVKTAYLIQKHYVEKRLSDDEISGFKAALIGKEASQKKFGVDTPLTSILFASGKYIPGKYIHSKSIINKCKGLMVETEIAFVAGKSITHPLKDVSELREYIQMIAPAIELPNLYFENMEQLKGVDILAANLVSNEFILGEEKKTEGLDVNSITVTVYLDGQIVGSGKGSDLGDQWEAALWMVTNVVRQGWKVEPGHVFLTGALGEMLPGKEGKYKADYGGLGEISFEIK